MSFSMPLPCERLTGDQQQAGCCHADDTCRLTMEDVLSFTILQTVRVDQGFKLATAWYENVLPRSISSPRHGRQLVCCGSVLDLLLNFDICHRVLLLKEKLLHVAATGLFQLRN